MPGTLMPVEDGVRSLLIAQCDRCGRTREFDAAEPVPVLQVTSWLDNHSCEA